MHTDRRKRGVRAYQGVQWNVLPPVHVDLYALPPPRVTCAPPRAAPRWHTLRVHEQARTYTATNMPGPSSRDVLRAAKAQLEEQQNEEEWQAVRSVATTLAALQAEMAALQASGQLEAGGLDDEEEDAAAAPAEYGYAPSDDEEEEDADADAVVREAAGLSAGAEAAMSGAGIRNRRTGAHNESAVDSGVASAEQVAREHNPDLDFKGDEEEDEVSDEAEETTPLLAESDEEDGDEPAGQSLADLRRTRAALLEVEEDDTRVVLGGVAGFFLAAGIGAMLVRHTLLTQQTSLHLLARMHCGSAHLLLMCVHLPRPCAAFCWCST